MYKSNEIVDSIIEEMYGLFKQLITGNYAGFCAMFSDIISKLAALRKGLKDEQDAKQRQIDDIKAQLERATRPDPGPGEQVIGGGTTEYRFGVKDGE